MPSTFRSNTYSPLSKRSTIASCWTDSGKLKLVQPYELRPNFIYKNNAFVMDGYIYEETETYNYFLTDKHFDSGQTEIDFPRLCDSEKVWKTIQDSVVANTTSNSINIAPNTEVLGSGFISKKSTCTYLDCWFAGSGSDGYFFDLTKGSVVANGSSVPNYSDNWKLGMEDYGDWWRCSIYCGTGNNSRTDVWIPCFIPRNGYCISTCWLYEKYQGSYVPSSWIPYNTVRLPD